MSFVRHPNEDKSLFPGYELSSVIQVTVTVHAICIGDTLKRSLYLYLMIVALVG